MTMSTLFLLSPARTATKRAMQLAASRTSPLGAQLRAGTAPLGDVFAWLSALYFRGKLAYARAFAQPSPGSPGALVMAPSLGLRAPETSIAVADLRAMAAVDVESAEFVAQLRRDAVRASAEARADTRVVLLGSIASGKYVDTLIDVVRRAPDVSGSVRRPRRHEPRRAHAARGEVGRRARVRDGRGRATPRHAPGEAAADLARWASTRASLTTPRPRPRARGRAARPSPPAPGTTRAPRCRRA